MKRYVDLIIKYEMYKVITEFGRKILKNDELESINDRDRLIEFKSELRRAINSKEIKFSDLEYAKEVLKFMNPKRVWPFSSDQDELLLFCLAPNEDVLDKLYESGRIKGSDDRLKNILHFLSIENEYSIDSLNAILNYENMDITHHHHPIFNLEYKVILDKNDLEEIKRKITDSLLEEDFAADDIEDDIHLDEYDFDEELEFSDEDTYFEDDKDYLIEDKKDLLLNRKRLKPDLSFKSDYVKNSVITKNVYTPNVSSASKEITTEKKVENSSDTVTEVEKIEVVEINELDGSITTEVINTVAKEIPNSTLEDIMKNKEKEPKKEPEKEKEKEEKEKEIKKEIKKSKPEKKSEQKEVKTKKTPDKRDEKQSAKKTDKKSNKNTEKKSAKKEKVNYKEKIQKSISNKSKDKAAEEPKRRIAKTIAMKNLNKNQASHLKANKKILDKKSK